MHLGLPCCQWRRLGCASRRPSAVQKGSGLPGTRSVRLQNFAEEYRADCAGDALRSPTGATHVEFAAKQSLLHRNGGNGDFTKTVKAIRGCNPDVPLRILEERRQEFRPGARFERIPAPQACSAWHRISARPFPSATTGSYRLPREYLRYLRRSALRSIRLSHPRRNISHHQIESHKVCDGCCHRSGRRS